MADGYDFAGDQLAALLVRRFFPERTQHESAIILDYLREHGAEYDRYSFSVRVGAGNPSDPEHLIGVQKSTSWSSRKRIDALFWSGLQPTIIEVKQRIGPETLGQLMTYRQLWLDENPRSLVPRLVAIGRTSDQDTVRVLNDHGADVYLYERAIDEG